MTGDGTGPRVLRRLVPVLLLAALALVLWLDLRLADWLIDALPMDRTGRVLLALLYSLLMAIPFFPAVELGIAIIVMYGREVVPLVWGCTVAALTLSFLVGRLIPEARIAALFLRLGQRRAAGLIAQLAPLTEGERLAVLLPRLSSRWLPWLLRHRYLALMLALNLPGNTLIGGGGGLALMAGLSGLFGPWRTLAAFAVGVSPVPLFILSTG